MPKPPVGCGGALRRTATLRSAILDLAAGLGLLGALDEARAAVKAGTCARPALYYPARRCNKTERQSNLPRWTRSHLRGHAHGGGARGVIGLPPTTFKVRILRVGPSERVNKWGGAARRHHDILRADAVIRRRPIHHSPVFWIGIVLCLAAIAVYLWSDDLSWRPASHG